MTVLTVSQVRISNVRSDPNPTPFRRVSKRSLLYFQLTIPSMIVECPSKPGMVDEIDESRQNALMLVSSNRQTGESRAKVCFVNVCSCRAGAAAVQAEAG